MFISIVLCLLNSSLLRITSRISKEHGVRGSSSILPSHFHPTTHHSLFNRCQEDEHPGLINERVQVKLELGQNLITTPTESIDICSVIREGIRYTGTLCVRIPPGEWNGVEI